MTMVESVVVHPLSSVPETIYVPATAGATMVSFWVLENPEGPDQLQEVASIPVSVSETCKPEQTGPEFPATTDGRVFTTTTVESRCIPPFESTMLTTYVPPTAGLTVGLWRVLEKAFGPLQDHDAAKPADSLSVTS